MLYSQIYFIREAIAHLNAVISQEARVVLCEELLPLLVGLKDSDVEPIAFAIYS